MNTVSVILINSGRDEDLVACANMLARHRTRMSIDLRVVAHDTSKAAERTVRSVWPGVCWVRVDAFGVGAMRNLGARGVTSDALMFLDTDTTLHDGALDTLVSMLGEDRRRAAVGPLLLNPDGTLQMSARAFYTPASMVLRRVPGQRAARSRSVRRHLIADWDRSSDRDVDWMVGACLVMRRSAFEDMGPFAETSDFGFEDVDWCFRAWLRGWRVSFVSSAVVTHEYVRSSDGLNRRTLSHAVAAARFFAAHGISGRRPTAVHA